MNILHEEALMHLAGKNIVVLDLETAHSADDCVHCGNPDGYCSRTDDPASMNDGHVFTRTGWENKRALGLSIGCYFAYQDMAVHWFDTHTLEVTVRHFVETQPLLVSFNGIQFDFALMRALLRYDQNHEHAAGRSAYAYPRAIHTLCDQFKAHCARSYDILAEIWRVDPLRKFERGLNSLDVIAQANGFGAKLMHGARAPRLWQQGRYAEVIAYCAEDVHKTRRLFEQIVAGWPLLRGDGLPIVLPRPATLEVQQ